MVSLSVLAQVRALLAGVPIGGGAPVAVMGALNVSPESFYAGSVPANLEALVATALTMVEAGASIIDVGARSTAPYRAADITTDEERGRLGRARRADIADEHVVLDPGIGFFRNEGVPWHEWDVRVLAGLARLCDLGRPLAVGVSRKSFIGALTGRTNPADRLAGSLAATALAVVNGAALIRTHDVADTKDAVALAESVARARRP